MIMEILSKTYGRSNRARNKIAKQLNETRFHCIHCNEVFATKFSRTRHENKRTCINQVGRGLWCGLCDKHFKNASALRRHDKRLHQSGYGMTQIHDVHGCETFENTYAPETVLTIEQCFARERTNLKRVMINMIMKKHAVKFGIVIKAMFNQIDEAGNLIGDTVIPLRASDQKIRFIGDRKNTDRIVNEAQKQILTRLDELDETGSGWVLNHVMGISIEVGRCSLLASGEDDLNLIDSLKGKEHLLDVKVKNNRCFLGAVAAYFNQKHPTTENVERFIEEKIDDRNIPFPFDLGDVERFERQNGHLHLAINIYQQVSVHGPLVIVFPTLN